MEIGLNVPSEEEMAEKINTYYKSMKTGPIDRDSMIRGLDRFINNDLNGGTWTHPDTATEASHHDISLNGAHTDLDIQNE